MDDLINRQDAIDALDGEITITGSANAEAVKGYVRLVADRLNRLPSAQPEIIRCKDCKYQSKGQNECETWNLCGYRPWQYTPTTDEHFCGYAERREE